MLSKNQLKYFASLKRKKIREEYQSFLAEGDKIVSELLSNPGFFNIKTLLALPAYLKELSMVPPDIPVIEINKKDLERISSLSAPNKALLEIQIPRFEWTFNEIKNMFCFFLDNIQDPGNLGTIIRTADWFGINPIFCSPGSVDLYNPKVIQASMGSISRIKVHYTEASFLLKNAEVVDNYTTIATIAGGKNLFNLETGSKGIIFFGNESKGLNNDIINKCKIKAGIPAYPEKSGAKSLNLAISVGIISSEIRRKKLIQNGS